MDVQFTDLDLYLRYKGQAKPIHANGITCFINFAARIHFTAGAITGVGMLPTLVFPGVTGLYITVAMAAGCAVLRSVFLAHK